MDPRLLYAIQNKKKKVAVTCTMYLPTDVPHECGEKSNTHLNRQLLVSRLAGCQVGWSVGRSWWIIDNIAYWVCEHRFAFRLWTLFFAYQLRFSYWRWVREQFYVKNCFTELQSWARVRVIYNFETRVKTCWMPIRLVNVCQLGLPLSWWKEGRIVDSLGKKKFIVNNCVGLYTLMI